MDQNIGANIRRIRKSRSMTQKVLAQKCNLAASTICDIEKGRSNPSLESLERIARALEISSAFLMTNNYVNNVENVAATNECINSSRSEGDKVGHL